MTSQINPNNIDGAYPVAGQDNNSQGFRDNFTNIKVNFQYAVNEIGDLQAKSVLKAALTGTTLDNNMNDNLIYAVKLQDVSWSKVSVGGTSGSIAINYASGQYQAITTSGSINLSFNNWPASGSYGYIKLQLNITNTAHTVTLPAAVTLGTAGIQGYSAGVITFASTGTYEFAFGTYDAGSTITIFDLNRALTNFTSFSVNSFSATGNVVGGNILTGGTVSATGNITGGNISTANINSALHSGTAVSVTGNVSGSILNGFVRPTAGSASQSPILFASGTNLSVPAAGAVEYDGKVFYGTPTASSRGVINSEYFIALSGNYTGADVDTAQKVFNGTSNGTITLAANTAYFMEGTYYITRGAGTTSHTLSTLFALGGSLTSIAYTADTTSTTGNTLGAVSRIYGTGATATIVTAASTSASENITVHIRGMLRTNAAGTFTPQIQYSAAPGGAPTILANSFFRLVPVGTGSVTTVGNWS
jgi:hypothetical protein